MIDFWYTLGGAIANNRVMTLIAQDFQALAAAGTALFTPFQAVAVTLDGTPLNPAPTTWGRLNQLATETMRDQIYTHLSNTFPNIATPVISLYTAGKLCQLWQLKNANLVGGLAQAGTAFRKANQDNPAPLSQPCCR